MMFLNLLVFDKSRHLVVNLKTVFSEEAAKQERDGVRGPSTYHALKHPEATYWTCTLIWTSGQTANGTISYLLTYDVIVTRLKQVTLTKRDTGDFGLSLRRSAVVEYRSGQAVTKTAFFAEPGPVLSYLRTKN